MEHAKPTKTPCCPSVRLVPHEGRALSDPIEYRSMVGALQYLTFTRPDLAFNVHQLCQFMSSPTTVHFEAAKRVLRGTLHHGISFTPGSLSLIAFFDADWAGDPSDRRSTSDMLVILGPSPVSWSPKKQPTVSHSSTEAEYRTLDSTATEISWLLILFKELHIFLPHIPVLWCDNVTALALTANPIFHSRTNIMKSIIIMFARRFCVEIWPFNLSLARIILLISSLNHCLLLRLFFNVANFWWIPLPVV